MTAHDSAATAQPGLMVGPTSEFSLFFRVKPGEATVAAGGAPRPAGHARVPAR